MFSYQIEENLRLVLPQKHHADEIAGVVRENLEQLSPWVPWATDDYSTATALDFIKNNLTVFAEMGSFATSIVWDEKIVGGIGFHNLDLNNKSAHIGYWLAKDVQGKGIVTKCCRALIDFLFDTLKLNRVQINCHVKNTKSRAIPEKLGFQLEGIHRQVEFLNDRFGDWAIYGMLKADWKKVKSEK